VWEITTTKLTPARTMEEKARNHLAERISAAFDSRGHQQAGRTAMTTFALVHGGWHGAWCWELVTPLLERAGHDVVAVDLPGQDGSATFDTYADVVCAAIDGCGDDVVVVGHSMNGATAPVVAARRPVRHIVYLCALIPAIGKSLSDQFATEDGISSFAWMAALGSLDDQGAQAWVDRALTRELLFGDCDDATAGRAIDRLRPQAHKPGQTAFSLTEFPSVSCTSVVCTDDRMVGPEWSRRVARERLGADIVELPGGHAPFLSRPADLAEVLLRISGEGSAGSAVGERTELRSRR
jgi:pimeloyl-ACP methyl ester carboxylesterase